MLKKIIINLLIGGAIFIFGAFLHDLSGVKSLGDFLAYAGIGYALISLGVIFFKKIPFVHKMVKDREKNKAHDELIRYKKLLDEGILSQDEFSRKSEDLKKKILQT